MKKKQLASRLVKAAWALLGVNLLFAFGSASSAFASNKYKCRVEQIVDQQFPIQESDIGKKVEAFISAGKSALFWNWFKEDGQILTDHLADLYIGNVFWVDSATAAITGDFNTATYLNTRVVSRGSKDWSFKVVYEGQPSAENYRHVIYLEIQEYALSIEKPFLASGMTAGSAVILGTCHTLQ